MKLFKSLAKIFRNSDLLAIIYPILLIVPNIMLDITEQYSFISKVTNILLPLGIYFLLMTARRRTGVMGLLMIPFAIFAAFQIVLLNLYGESIIAVDMFINVATTNVAEVTELLGNLVIAIAVICILYLPPIIASAIQTASHSEASQRQLHRARITGSFLTAAGVISACCAYSTDNGYRIDRELFPVNVISNLCSAVSRTIATNNYESTSAGFDYSASSTRPADEKEIYVLVVGETARADNWQLTGYDRPTNPRLSKRGNLYAYPLALSESNTTHKSVPMILSPLTAANFGDSIYYTRSIFDAFNQAGYATAFISNQRRNRSFIDFFGEQAATTEFIIDEFDSPQHDLELVTRMKRVLDNAKADKVMIVLHSYGSHFNYRERYPRESAVFTPDVNSEAAMFNRDQLVNAYDNTIVYTDMVLDSIMSAIDSYNTPAALVYLSDHGEDIFDDSRERFLHASPVGTFHQLHVPFIVWMNDEYLKLHPEKAVAAKANLPRNVSASASAFHTVIDLASISTPYFNPMLAVTDSTYREPARLFLNDYLEGVSLYDAGLRQQDFRLLDSKGFRY